MMIAEKVQARGEGIENSEVRPASQDDRTEPKKLGGLVLARQLGESIVIGDSVIIEVIGLKSNTVRLRVVAPRSVAVHRREVYDAIRLSPQPAPATVASPVPSEAAAVGSGQQPEGSLVLTRRTGETIMIGNEVAVDVVEARPGTVRLRVIAPRSITVHRREVYDAIQAGESRFNSEDFGPGR